MQKSFAGNRPDPAARPFADAMAHHQAGRLDEAEKFYRLALGLVPDHAEALRLLGTLCLQQKRHAEALPLLMAARQKNPRNDEVLNNIGLVYREQGDAAAAEAFFKEALTIRPEQADALNNLSTLYLAEGKAEAAVPLLEQALRHKPGFPQATANLAAAYAQTGQPGKAADLFEDLVKRYPSENRYWISLGNERHRTGRLDDAFAAYQRSLLLTGHDHPAAAPVYVAIGHIWREKRKYDEAISCFNKALQLDERMVEVYIPLGSCWWEKGKLSLALNSFELAVANAPQSVPALVSLGALEWAMGRRTEGRQHIEQALALQPDDIAALVNYGIMFHDEGYPEKALAPFDRVLALQPNNDMAAWRKSLSLLATGDYRNGWAMYEAGLGHPARRGVPPFNVKIWDGQPLPAKHLVIWSEQGFGDSLQFIRFAAEARKQVGRLTVLCPQPLVRLFNALPYVDEAKDTMLPNGVDQQIAMLSLPRLFGARVDDLPSEPYLRVPGDVREKWSARFEGVDGFKVGLVWGGSPREGQVDSGQVDRRRSIPLEKFKPLLQQDGVRFYTLQKGLHAQQIKDQGLQDRLTDYMDNISDFADTAALIERMDLVITVDTSVAHLAGGLGKRVWILSRFDACWRWLKNRPDSPWYPTARVYGQPTPGDWDSVLAEVEKDLNALVSVGASA